MRRRTVLVGAVGVVAVAGGGRLATWTGPGIAPPAPLRVLNRAAFTTLSALALVVCQAPPPAPSAAEVGVAAKVDALLDAAPSATGDDLVLALHLLESPACGLVDGRWGPFSTLSDEDRLAVVGAWRAHPSRTLRGAMRALVHLCLGSYWSNPRTWPAVGYPGPPVAA